MFLGLFPCKCVYFGICMSLRVCVTKFSIIVPRSFRLNTFILSLRSARLCVVSLSAFFSFMCCYVSDVLDGAYLKIEKKNWDKNRISRSYYIFYHRYVVHCGEHLILN